MTLPKVTSFLIFLRIIKATQEALEPVSSFIASCVSSFLVKALKKGNCILFHSFKVLLHASCWTSRNVKDEWSFYTDVNHIKIDWFIPDLNPGLLTLDSVLILDQLVQMTLEEHTFELGSFPYMQIFSVVSTTVLHSPRLVKSRIQRNHAHWGLTVGYRWMVNFVQSGRPSVLRCSRVSCNFQTMPLKALEVS